MSGDDFIRLVDAINGQRERTAREPIWIRLDPNCAEEKIAIGDAPRELLDERRIQLTGRWPREIVLHPATYDRICAAFEPYSEPSANPSVIGRLAGLEVIDPRRHPGGEIDKLGQAMDFDQEENTGMIEKRRE